MEVWLIDTLAPGSPSTVLDEHDELGWFDLSNPASRGWTDPRRINVVVTVGTTVNAAHRPRPGAVVVAQIGEITRLHLGPNLTRSPGHGDAKDITSPTRRSTQ
jgi:hypothetical protein